MIYAGPYCFHKPAESSTLHLEILEASIPEFLQVLHRGLDSYQKHETVPGNVTLLLKKLHTYVV